MIYMNDKEEEGWEEYYKKEITDWMARAQKALKEGKKAPPVPDLNPFSMMPPGPPHGPPPHPDRRQQPSRSNVVASRIGNKELEAVDMLVEAGPFGTRSVAVAYLVAEGIKARSDVMDQVSRSLDEIREINRKKDERITKLREALGIDRASSS